MFRFNTLSFAFVCMLCVVSLIAVPLINAKEDMDYDKKLYKILKKKEIKTLPSNSDYPGADAIVIHQEIFREQFFGYFSLWDITYKEKCIKIWKVINPAEPRLQKVTIELGQVNEIEEFDLYLYPFKGESARFKITNLQIQTYNYLEGGTAYKRAVLDLPALQPDTIIEMEYILEVKEPLFFDYDILQGADPILSLSYGFAPPEFIRLAPTQLYAPVSHSNQFQYKFLAFDAVNKKAVLPKQKNGFFFTFNDLPAIKVDKQHLPLANQSSFIAFCVNELIIKDPLARYDEAYQAYMQIPPETADNFIRSAGSPEAYKIGFANWDDVSDYLYFDLLDGIQNSTVFAAVAKEIVSDISGDILKLQKIYNFMATEFTRTEYRPDFLYALPLKDIETALTNRQAHQFDLGFIFWGLLHHAGITGSLGVGFDHNQYIGEYVLGRKFPMPTAFNTSLVLVGEAEKARLYFPGDPALRLGSYPPEIEGSDFLILTLKTQAERANENLYQTDKLNPYIKVRQNPRMTTEWQFLQIGVPTVNQVASKLELNISEEGAIKVIAQSTFSGHEETVVRRELLGKSSTDAEKYAREWYEKQLENATINSLSIKHLNDFAAALEFDAELALPLEIKDNTLSIPFSFFNQTKLLPVADAQKKVDALFFPYRSFVWNDFMVTFEKGWKVKSKSQPAKIETENGMIATNIRETEIQYNYQRGFTLIKIFMSGQEVQTLLDYFSKVKELELSDVLVLEKISSN